MSRYIVKNDVTCGIVICGCPCCLTEIHKLRIQQIPVCHVNPQIRLRNLWTVPCFSYRHDFLIKMSQSVCMIHTGTFHWNEVLTELFVRILLLSTFISIVKRSLDPPTQGHTQFLPAIAASVFSVCHLPHCMLRVTLPVFHVMCLLGKLFTLNKYMHKQGKAVHVSLELVNAQSWRWKQHKQSSPATVLCLGHTLNTNHLNN
jgi:hypothetical protein